MLALYGVVGGSGRRGGAHRLRDQHLSVIVIGGILYAFSGEGPPGTALGPSSGDGLTLDRMRVRSVPFCH